MDIIGKNTGYDGQICIFPNKEGIAHIKVGDLVGFQIMKPLRKNAKELSQIVLKILLEGSM
jgi:hypothetical protein